MLYNFEGEETRIRIPKGLCHFLGLPHGASDCIITDSTKERFLITMRAQDKLWDAGVGGHHSAGVSVIENMIKEIQEELFSYPESIEMNTADPLYQKINAGLKFLSKTVNTNKTPKGETNIHVSQLFVLTIWNDFEKGVRPLPEEISEYKWVSLDTIEKLINTPEVCSGFNIIWTQVLDKKLI